MSDLTKAFEDMRREGLIAQLECYCPGCGRDKAMEEARQSRGRLHAATSTSASGSPHPAWKNYVSR